jgi:hypothetical protein
MVAGFSSFIVPEKLFISGTEMGSCLIPGKDTAPYP